MDISPIIVPIILALIAAASAPGIWALVAQRRRTAAETEKIHAETTDLIQKSAGELVMAYKTQVLELKKEIEETKEEFEKIKKELTSRIIALELELKDTYIEIHRQNEIIKELNRRMSKSGQ